MHGFKLFAKLSLYYAAIAAIVFLALSMWPGLKDYMPIGGVEALISQPDANPLEGGARSATAQEVGSFGESLFWLCAAIFGALLTALPVSWVYMEIRTGEEYDQSLISTILILPLVVTSIVIVVQSSLALAFALGGIAGAVRFKNSLKSSGDALFILLSVGIGISSGIGAVELAMVMSFAFNFCFVALWISEYGERHGMKRYMSDFDPSDSASGTAASAAIVPPPVPPAT